MYYRYLDVLDLGEIRCYVLNNILTCILTLIQSEQVIQKQRFLLYVTGLLWLY